MLASGFSAEYPHLLYVPSFHGGTLGGGAVESLGMSTFLSVIQILAVFFSPGGEV